MAGNGKRKVRRRPGSARRKPVGKAGAKVHNAPREKWIKVCGEVTRMGGQLVEIPATGQKPLQ
jgi:hypothetical protein